MDLAILDNRYLLAAVSLAAGVISTVIAQQILNRRGLLTYFVRHDRVGVSADDQIFGSVRVTWNNNPVRNLFHSTVELVNESFTDFENVTLTAYTSDTVLLSERTEVVGTTHIVKWSPEYLESLRVPTGQAPTPQQFELHGSRREYRIPTLNRGQVIRLYFLNSARGDGGPSIWLDVLHKGLRLRFRAPHNQIMGVPQPRAALIGAIAGFSFAGATAVYVDSVAVAAIACLVFGFVAQVPGALVIKLWRRVRDLLGG